jgi:TatD DNase family protein
MIPVGLVDFHCHLDLYPDHASEVAACERESVYTLSVTTTPKAWPRNRDLTAQTKHVRTALGLHPQLAKERSAEIKLWEEYLPETRYVGEVGLDAGTRFYGSFDLQKRLFETILRACAEAGGKVLTVHSVRAAKPVLDMIEAYLPRDRGRVVLHWFSGSTAEAKRATELGCYFSVNAEMVRTPHGRDLLATLAFERVLTETDGPFTKVDGRPTRPVDAVRAVEALAAARGVTAGTVITQVRANLRTLLDDNENPSGLPT